MNKSSLTFFWFLILCSLFYFIALNILLSEFLLKIDNIQLLGTLTNFDSHSLWNNNPVASADNYEPAAVAFLKKKSFIITRELLSHTFLINVVAAVKRGMKDN